MAPTKRSLTLPSPTTPWIDPETGLPTRPFSLFMDSLRGVLGAANSNRLYDLEFGSAAPETRLAKLTAGANDDGALPTANIQKNAVTAVGSGETEAGLDLSNNTWTLAEDFSIDATGGPIVLLAGAIFDFFKGIGESLDNIRAEMRIVRYDGSTETTVWEGRVLQQFVSLDSVAVDFTAETVTHGYIPWDKKEHRTVTTIDQPSAGTYTYRLYVLFWTPSLSIGDHRKVSQRSIVGLELRDSA